MIDKNSKTALLVLFNHRYDKNIPILRSLYASKFSVVRFLVPFYDGDDEDVIPVYNNSKYFQGFFASSYNQIKELDVDRYLIVADDMIINPAINSDSVCDVLNIGEHDNFISNVWPLHSNENWAHYKYALDFSFKQKGIEVQDVFPKVDVALKRLEKYGVKMSWVESTGKSVAISYPLVCGYSDFFIVNKSDYFNFCRYSGVFAALGLFVEVAIPTVLSLVTSTNLHTSGSSKSGLRSGAMWSSLDCDNFFDSYDGKISSLINDFPGDKLFVHPIKLSKWSNS
jgi:hypothetical protein